MHWIDHTILDDKSRTFYENSCFLAKHQCETCQAPDCRDRKQEARR